MLNELEYYSTAGKLTNLAGYMETIDELTDNPEFICQIVQGLMIHGGWIKVYNIEQKHRSLSNSLYMSDLLGEIINADQRSLTIPPLPENRVIGDCCRFLSSYHVQFYGQNEYRQEAVADFLST